MKCRESVELFTYKDKFGRQEYLAVDHIRREAYIVRSPDHFDNMVVISDLVRLMNAFKLYGDRDFTTIDVNLGLARYAAIHSKKRRSIDYLEFEKRLRQKAAYREDPSS